MLTYVVPYKLSWYWIGIVRFVSQEVWFDEGFVIWHFLNYCLEQIVLLWSLSSEIRIIYIINVLVDRISNMKSNASQSD